MRFPLWQPVRPQENISWNVANRRQHTISLKASHELLGGLIPQLDKFQSSRRFRLVEHLETDLLEVFELTVEAAFTHNKRTALHKANQRLEVVKHLWRLALELQTVALRQYEHGVRLLDDLGRQLGGWLKAIERRPA